MMAELPLALFTTLAPIGAGAFIALAVAFFTTKFSDEQLKKIDRMTTIPVVVLVAGFICAFFHLACVRRVRRPGCKPAVQRAARRRCVRRAGYRVLDRGARRQA